MCAWRELFASDGYPIPNRPICAFEGGVGLIRERCILSCCEMGRSFGGTKQNQADGLIHIAFINMHDMVSTRLASHVLPLATCFHMLTTKLVQDNWTNSQ